MECQPICGCQLQPLPGMVGRGRCFALSHGKRSQKCIASDCLLKSIPPGGGPRRHGNERQPRACWRLDSVIHGWELAVLGLRWPTGAFVQIGGCFTLHNTNQRSQKKPTAACSSQAGSEPPLHLHPGRQDTRVSSQANILPFASFFLLWIQSRDQVFRLLSAFFVPGPAASAQRCRVSARREVLQLRASTWSTSVLSEKACDASVSWQGG